MSCGSAYDSFLKYFVCAWKECVLRIWDTVFYIFPLGQFVSIPSLLYLFLYCFGRLLLHIFAQIITSLYSSLYLQIIFLERSSLTIQSQIGFISHFLYPVLFSLKHYLYLPSHYISVCLLSISLIVINTYWGKEIFCLVFCAITSTWKELYTICSINMFWMIKQMN